MLKVDAVQVYLTTHAPNRDGHALCKARIAPGQAMLAERRAPTSGASLRSLRKAHSVRVAVPSPSCPDCLKKLAHKPTINPTLKTFAPYQGAWR